MYINIDFTICCIHNDIPTITLLYDIVVQLYLSHVHATSVTFSTSIAVYKGSVSKLDLRETTRLEMKRI
jgi:hypothetical protein